MVTGELKNKVDTIWGHLMDCRHYQPGHGAGADFLSAVYEAAGR